MKKKILAFVLCIAMLAIAVVGGCLAYFTDTEAQTNVFTAGRVGIVLDEAIVALDASGNLTATGNRTTDAQQEYELFPAQVVTKDPTITVDSDSEDVYLAAKVVVTEDNAGDLESLIGTGYQGLLDITLLVSGGYVQTGASMKDYNGLGNGVLPVYGDAAYSVYQQIENGAYVFYIFIEDIKTAGDSVTLFDTLTIPADWDNAEMAKINGMEIEVKAFATQANGFADCFTAMTTAFDTEFNFS